MMRARTIVVYGTAALVLAVCAEAANYVPDGKPNDPGSKACDCSNIVGVIGNFDDWISESGSFYNFSDGEYGGFWKEQEYPLCGNSGSQEDTILHKFKKTAGTVNNRWLHVNVMSTPVFSGRAEQLNPADPEWWWRCTCIVGETRPLSKMKLGSGDWQEIPMQIIGSTTEEKAANDVRGKANGAWYPQPIPANTMHPDPNDPTAPPQSYPVPVNYPLNILGTDPTTGKQLRPGKFRGRSGEKLPVATVAVKTEVTLDVVATVSGDNTKVSDWKVALDFWMKSEMKKTSTP